MQVLRMMIAAAGLMLVAGGAWAQGAPMHGAHGAHVMGQGSPPPRTGAVPAEAGQAAFAAIAEIVRLLQADPRTDWTKVDIEALRQHLIDMDEVTMRAAAAPEPVQDGTRIAVTGSGRTLAAIRRMVPDHAREIDGMNGWRVLAREIPDGVELTVTAADPAAGQMIRGLGFIGIMAQGAHHQAHHLAMARGEMAHRH